MINLTINKKEKNLLIVLLMLLLVYVSILNMKRIEKKREEIEKYIEEKEKQVVFLKKEILGIDYIREEVDLKKSIIDKKIGKYLSPTTLKQEDIIYLLSSLTNTNDFEIKDMTFTVEYKNKKEDNVINIEDKENSLSRDTVNEIKRLEIENKSYSNIKIRSNFYDYNNVNLHLRIDFSTDYVSLIDFVKKINDLNKSIYVRSIKFQPKNYKNEPNITEDEIIKISTLLEGEMIITFAYLPMLDEFGFEELFQFNYENTKTKENTPFIPHTEFIESLVIASAEEITKNIDKIEGDWGIESFEEQYNAKRTLIETFDLKDYFFVGTPKEVKGRVLESANSISGNAGQLDYIFTKGKNENTANLVFDKNARILTNQVEEISMLVHSDEYAYSTVGVVILDSSGKQFNIDLTDGIYWTGWQELTMSLPPEINYPSMITRIYVNDKGEKSKLSGTLRFDNLKVLYTKDKK